MDYERAMEALDRADKVLDPEDMDALSAFISLFEPYDGDDPEEARARGSAKAHCKNCEYEVDTMFHPSELHLAASASLRLAMCPRCFSTQMLMGGALTKEGVK